MASFEPSRRNTDAVASIKPSMGIRSGSLWPPTKLYFGNPGKRGDGAGKSLAKCEVRLNAALMSFPPSAFQKGSHGGVVRGKDQHLTPRPFVALPDPATRAIVPPRQRRPTGAPTPAPPRATAPA